MRSGRSRFSGWLLLCGWLTFSAAAQADDVIRLQRREADAQAEYALRVMQEAMRRSEASHGPWRIEFHTEPVVRERVLEMIIDGSEVNAAVVASQPQWEDRLLPVWIPLDMGLSGYRIGLIARESRSRIEAVKTLAQLQQLRIGAGMGWSSRKIMEASGLQLVLAPNQAGLTRMLAAGRMDYFPRSVREAFDELAEAQKAHPALIVDRHLLLVMPLPTYIFVSPAHPRLAQRLQSGLESMVRDGSLLRMMLQQHGGLLAQAGLCERTLIRIPNPLLSARHPLQRRELWFDPFAPESGLCRKASAERKS
jgi:hypothetical protein